MLRSMGWQAPNVIGLNWGAFVFVSREGISGAGNVCPKDLWIRKTIEHCHSFSNQTNLPSADLQCSIPMP